MKRIAIAWPGFTGYMGPCFKALAAHCNLRVFIEPSSYEQQFGADAMAGVSFRRVNGAGIPEAIDEVQRLAPDLTLVCGWRTPLARAFARAEISGRKVIAFDMPWEWTFRKIVARWALWPRLRHFDAAFVPGRRCARYARWLGFSGRRLSLGSNPGGWERFADSRSLGSLRSAKGFLFAGRFSDEKGIDVLLSAYSRYRTVASRVWNLDLAGSGPAIPSRLPDGVRVLGFVPPNEMPKVMRDHACLVQPSRWEPWGVAAAEAMSAGLVTILSDRCGIVDDVRPTCVVRHDSTGDLADALVRVSSMSDAERQAESRRTLERMECYSAENWARRVLELATVPSASGSSTFHKRGFA